MGGWRHISRFLSHLHGQNRKRAWRGSETHRKKRLKTFEVFSFVSAASLILIFLKTLNFCFFEDDFHTIYIVFKLLKKHTFFF